jgi:predicted AAA+ superfamily ATPase
MNLEELLFNFDCLSIYRKFLEDKVIEKLYKLIDYINKDKPQINGFMRLYNEFYFELVTLNSTATFKEYIIEKIIFDENPFSMLGEKECFENIDKHLIKAVSRDLDSLYAISSITSDEIKEFALEKICGSSLERDAVNNLASWEFEKKSKCSKKTFSLQCNDIFNEFYLGSTWGEKVKEIGDFYYKNGCGIFARYSAFVWEHTEDASGYLRGIESPDPVRLSDFIGYEEQRLDVIKNTEKFVNGFSANNVLLYGDRGTGKSSTVKAIGNEYSESGLRIIEVSKKHLTDFPAIIRQVKNRKCKFIIFVDDLSFEDTEESYTVLKSVLEGGVENRPDNVLIYATSNRRHLVKEKFSEREGLKSGNFDDEVRARDTIQEKLSLSERFGITVVFSSPDKKEFLEIVEGLAEKRGINVDKDWLQKEAMKWELMYNGRSARTAKQFIDWLEGSEFLK